MYPTIPLLSFASIICMTTSVTATPFGDLPPTKALQFRDDPPDPAVTSRGQTNNCINPQNTERGRKITCCKPKAQNSVDGDGDCGPLAVFKEGNLQAAFCQTDLSWDYGKELVFNSSTCACGDSKYAMTSTKSVTVTNTYEFNIRLTAKRSPEERDGEHGLKPADSMSFFNAGASFSYSVAHTSGTATTNTKPENVADKCGYWTFVPYYITTWGTLTYLPSQNTETGLAANGDQKTIPGFCQKTPFVDGQGEWKAAHRHGDLNKEVLSTGKLMCQNNVASFSDGGLDKCHSVSAPKATSAP